MRLDSVANLDSSPSLNVTMGWPKEMLVIFWKGVFIDTQLREGWHNRWVTWGVRDTRVCLVFSKVKRCLLEHWLTWDWEKGIWGRLIIRAGKHGAQSENIYDGDQHVGQKVFSWTQWIPFWGFAEGYHGETDGRARELADKGNLVISSCMARREILRLSFVVG